MTQEQFFSRFKYDPDTDLLGGGGYGKVYKAFDETRNRWIAIKVAELKTGQESVSLKKEVELAKALPDHKNVAHYESCDRFKTLFGTFDYGVLQYYPLGNLSKLVRSKKLKPADKENIAKGILSGIQHLHRHNVIHRDLKSANILIAEGYLGEYVPKIADFGLSKYFSDQDKSYFSNSFAGGSLLYVAPEQLAGNREIRKNVDLWSLGVLLYELFTGDVPFKATVDDGSETARAEIIRKIAHAEIPTAIRTIPAPWQEIIIRCLVVDPKIRTKSIEEVMILAGMIAAASKFGDTEPDPPPKPPKPDSKPIKLKPWLIGAGIGLLLLFGGIWLVNSFQKHDDGLAEEVTEVVDTTAAVVDTDASIAEVSNANTENRMVDDKKKDKVPGNDPAPMKEKQLTPAQRAAEEIASTMVRIPGGSFMMGCTDEQGGDCSDDERPAHERRVSTFYMNKYEVTQAQWRAIMGNNPSYFKNCDRCPVEQVSWNDTQEFIRKLNNLTGSKYRLPTETEWEYAARGGQNFKYAGSNTISNVAWYEENSGEKTRRVGQKSSNGYGLYDMSGNVWEWCSDWFKGYPGSSGVSDFTGTDRVLRGGGWFNIAQGCRVSLRNYDSPTLRSNFLGFRLAL